MFKRNLFQTAVKLNTQENNANFTRSFRLRTVSIFPLDFVEPRNWHRERRRTENYDGSRKNKTSTHFPRAGVRDVFTAAPRTQEGK